MLYGIVDDRSGVAFQQYNAVYGEDAEYALRFLFSAMSAKAIEGFPFLGIPEMIYMENGPIAKKQCFSKSYAISWGSHPLPSPSRKRWPKNHGTLKRKSGKTLPDYKRSSRNPLSFSLFACFLSIHKRLYSDVSNRQNILTDQAIMHSFMHFVIIKANLICILLFH